MGLRSVAIVLILAGILLSESAATFASETPIALYNRPGQPRLDYDTRVKNIRSGNLLQFSNGRNFKVLEILGQGGTSLIIRAEDTQTQKQVALRIPRSQYVGFGGEDEELMSDYLSSFLHGQKVYKKAGVPVVEVLPELSFPKEYVAVEEMKIEFTLQDVLSSGDQIPLKLKKHVIGQPLTDFARHLWNFSEIGDCRPENIGWVDGRWVLFDMTDEFKLYRAGDKAPPHDLLNMNNPLSVGNSTDYRLDIRPSLANIENVILEQRRSRRFTPDLKESDPVVSEAKIRKEYRKLVRERMFRTDVGDPKANKRIAKDIRKLQKQYRKTRAKCVIDVLHSDLNR